jgi:Flp pilus assembly pilin Flp
MWQRIKEIPNRVYPAITSIVHSFGRDERGLSGVVVAILLILVAVLAIVLIWGFLSGWLQDLWEQITGSAGGIS